MTLSRPSWTVTNRPAQRTPGQILRPGLQGPSQGERLVISPAAARASSVLVLVFRSSPLLTWRCPALPEWPSEIWLWSSHETRPGPWRGDWDGAGLGSEHYHLA